MQNKRAMDGRLLNKKVLVTGGAGFIGSNIIEALLKQGNKVVCLDNLLTGNIKNIEVWFDNPDFKFIEGDIRNLVTCKDAMTGVEVVLHQAALGSVPRSIENPITTNEINISGFLNVIQAAKEEGVKRFVYASSSSVYGDEPNLPKVENRTGKVLSPYAVTKAVNEEYARLFADLYGMETIGLRYFNVFGKKQDPNGPYAAVIPKFIKMLIAGEAPVMFGDGEQSRDFTYIENVIQINQLAATTTNKDALNRVYNVAYGSKATLNELFGLLKQLVSRKYPHVAKMEAVYGEMRRGDILHSLADITTAKKLLGYDPLFNLQDGIVHTIDWYLENL